MWFAVVKIFYSIEGKKMVFKICVWVIEFMQYALSMPQLNKMEMTDSFVIVRTVKSPWIFHQIEMRREKKNTIQTAWLSKASKIRQWIYNIFIFGQKC